MTATFAMLSPGVFAAQAFSPDEAAVVRRMAEETPAWSPAVINGDAVVDRAIRDADTLQADANPRLVGLCHQRLLAVTSEHAATVAPEGRLAEMQFVRYAARGGYLEHRDTPARGATPRVLSLVCYLNDDFQGGATAFADSGVRVRPQSGLVLAFDPLLLHAAEPVTSGVKFAITAWYHVRG